MSSHSGMTPIPKSPTPPARTGTPEPMDERHLKLVKRAPPTPPVRTEITKYLVFVLDSAGIRIIVGIQSPRAKYDLSTDVPNNLYALRILPQRFTKDELEKLDYRSILSQIKGLTEADVDENKNSQTIAANNMEAKRMMSRSLFLYCVDVEKSGEQIMTPHGTLHPNFVGAIDVANEIRLDWLTDVTPRVELILVVAEEERKPAMAYFIFCQKMGTPLKDPLPNLPNDLRPFKVSLPVTKDGLYKKKFAELVGMTDEKKEEDEARMVAEALLEKKLHFVHRIADVEQKMGLIMMTDERLNPEFVDALFDRNEEALNSITSVGIDIVFD